MPKSLSNELLRRRIAEDITAQLSPGTYNLSIDQAATILGCHSGHIRNQISDGFFPIETIQLGRRRFVPLTNLIDYLAGLIVGQSQLVKPRSKRGRRTKAAQRILREQQTLSNGVAEQRGVL